MIDCTIPNNNLLIVDESKTYSYCANNTGKTFKFEALESNFVAIQKYGIVSFTMKIEYYKNYVPSEIIKYQICLLG